MKTLITGLLLLVSLGASAFEVEVYSNVHNKWAEDVSIDNIKFAVNAPMGRAAVKFLLWDNSDDDSGNYDYKTEVIDGLYFDQATQNIMYNNTVCATTKIKRGIFGSKRKIKTTGNCTFRVEKSKIQIDNGFDYDTKNKIALYMNVR